MIKRFLSILLSLILIIQFFPVQILAEELNNNIEEVEGVSKNLSDSTLSAQDLVTSEQYTVLVLDGSGSMGGDPIKALKEAVMTFTYNLISSSNKIAVVSFGSSATILANFTDNISDIQSILEDIYNGGGTNVKSGLEKANDLLTGVPAEARKNLVVFSDGEPGDRWESLNYAHSLQNVDIYTIGFFQDLSASSKESAEEFLRELCNKNYYDITNIDDFNEVFKDVAGDIKLSDQMKTYIQDHKNYINGDYYNNEINPGLYGASAEALDSIKDNWSLKGYNVVTKLNDLLGGKVSKENYYKYILAAFVDSEKNHASCNNEYLSSLQTNLEQVYFTSLTNVQTNINAGVPGIDPNEYNAARVAYDQMKDADFLSSDYKYSKQALDTCMSKLIGSATGQFKSDISSALGFDVGLLDSVIDVSKSTMEEVVDQASCYQAYATISLSSNKQI